MSLMHQIAKVISEHPYLYNGVKVVGGFLLGLFVKEPIERWRKERGKLGRTRDAMYSVLAEIYTGVERYFGVIERTLSREDQEQNSRAIASLVESFYEEINAHKYDALLKDLRAVRTSIVAEARGFELVMEYLAALPSKQAPIQEKWSALTNFFKKFNKAMLIEQFDRKRLSLAIEDLKKLEQPRQLKAAAIAIRNAADKAAEIQKVINKAVDDATTCSISTARVRQPSLLRC
jgi:hypothetical protein